MTSYAPNVVVLTAPSPALSGTSLTVGSTGLGSAFPEAPFRALVWPNQQLPDVGDNAEELTVVGKDGDVFELLRGTVPIAITAGMRIAVLATQTVYHVGDLVDVSDGSFAGTAPFTFHVRDPGGYAFSEAGRPTAQWGGSAGAAHLARRGQYFYQFEDVHGVRSSEQDFFIAFTEVS